MKRKLIIALALCLALALGIGGTMAYLTATTTEVKNTFTIGKVGLTLTEPEGEKANYQFKMVPGDDITKDPTVTVTGGSEDCWLFVSLTKENDFDTYLTYEMADGWVALDKDQYPGVYYREVSQADANQVFSVLKGDEVTVSTDVENFQAKTEGETFAQPTLTIKAAAIQKANIATAADAYDKLAGNL